MPVEQREDAQNCVSKYERVQQKDLQCGVEKVFEIYQRSQYIKKRTSIQGAKYR